MFSGSQRPPALAYGEDHDEKVLMKKLEAELGVEAVLLVPTCTMANQIAIRLHLANGGELASCALSHIVTVEASATALTGVSGKPLASENGHLSPAAVEGFLAGRSQDDAALIWLENTHMLSAGSVMPSGWQAAIGGMCKPVGVAVHLDGSRLWNAAVAQDAPVSALVAGCNTVAISLNKAVGAPCGSVLGGSREDIAKAVHLRSAMGGEWRPIGSIASAALAALDGWRDRLEADAFATRSLATSIVGRLGEHAVLPAPTNLIFLSRPNGDAARFVEALSRLGVKALVLTPEAVRLAIHSGVRDKEVEIIANVVKTADIELNGARP